MDVACGSGRHARYFLDLGHCATLVDIDVSKVADLSGRRDVEIVRADLEGAAWPFGGRRFEAVVVTNYLWRPLFPDLVSAVAPGGILIYETFAEGNDAFGRPRNPDFLLREGELLDRIEPHLEVIDFEAGFFHETKPAILQRICARRREDGNDSI